MNTRPSHGPGFDYDEPVGPKGSALAWWIVITIGAALAWLFGL